MRTALILLLLLALAAIPGSIIPQEGVDALKASNWQADHPKLTPVYERLGLFSVYDSPWFSAIYLLLMLSLVGCIVPRTWHYWRGIRAKPPAAPRNLTRLPDHASYHSTEDPDVVLERARQTLRKRRYRLSVADDAVSAERGYLREVGNLVFHLSVLVVLVGFAVGSLFGYKGGVILGGRQRLLEHAHAVRRLRPRQPVPRRGHGAVLPHRRRLRRRLAHRAARRPGRRAASRRTRRTRSPSTRPRRSTTSRSTTRCRSATPRCSSSGTATRR